MKFEWKFDYVPEGQMEPDKFNRWAVICYMFVSIEKALPQYKGLKGMYEDDFMPVAIAYIFQKGTDNGHVPSLLHKFCACIPTFDECGNGGMSTERYFYADDLQELKTIVEQQFTKTQNVFLNCK